MHDGASICRDGELEHYLGPLRRCGETWSKSGEDKTTTMTKLIFCSDAGRRKCRFKELGKKNGLQGNRFKVWQRDSELLYGVNKLQRRLR